MRSKNTTETKLIEPIIEKIKKTKRVVQENFRYIDDPKKMPSKMQGSSIVKINKSPKLVFHFLEFLFDKEYVDLYKMRGFVFVDDKVTWDFLLKTKHGHIRIYDWKGYSVSIGSTTSEVSEEIKEESLMLKNLIEEGVDIFLEYRQIESKRELEERPLDNFMNAWVSIDLLFQFSLERTKRENFGLIESLILLVSLIDTMLRYSILLTRINDRKSTTIDPDFPELYFQKDNKHIKEREIFNIAEKEVSFENHNKEDFFKRVNELYNWRNRAVHRYAITNLQYVEIKDVIDKYKDLKEILSSIIIKLEHEQVKLGVGFLKEEELLPQSEDEMIKIMDNVFETKVNPRKILKKSPEREAMFSDKYRGGVNPKIRKIINKYKKELSQKITTEKVSENKYQIKPRK